MEERMRIEIKADETKLDIEIKRQAEKPSTEKEFNERKERFLRDFENVFNVEPPHEKA
jgi:HSP20 family molecular chaperone IbpA